MSSPNQTRASRRQAGFTLVEVMIGALLSGAVLTAVLSAFLMIGRSGALLYNYTELEQQARRGLEKFSQDTRMASGVTWTSTSRVTLTVPHVTDAYSNTVVYWWDTTSGSSTYHCFMRQESDTDSSGTATTTSTSSLIQNVQTFQFDRWTAGGTPGTQASGDLTTDQLQIHLTLSTQSNQYGTSTSAVAAATNLVVSARYILRNKPS
jgi:Tfp pilus assembly protein PilW